MSSTLRRCAIAASALTLTLAASPVLADDHGASAAIPPTAKQTVMPESESARGFFEEYGFAEAAIHNGTVYLSGVIVGPPSEGGDEAEAYDRVFAYLGDVLHRAGSSWDDVIDITTFHVDIDQSMPPLLAAKTKVVKAPFPAWTAIDVDRLFVESGLVEIKIIARVTPDRE